MPIFDDNERNAPSQKVPEKDHRTSISLGADITGSLKFGLSFKRLLSQSDLFDMGVKSNQFGQSHYWLTHTMPFQFRNQ